MQDFSILQLLRTLSAAADGQGRGEKQGGQNDSAEKNGGAMPAANDAPRQKEGEKESPHARSEKENAAFAYENFLTRHDRAVQRIKGRGGKDKP